MKGSITIQSAIDELQRSFKLFNEIYFCNELETPVITILTDVTSGSYGWLTQNKVWSSKDKNWFREINLCAEYLNRSTELIIAVLIHEMCHLYNIQKGIKDTSRSGTYHNLNFKNVAERCGLNVGQNDKYGYCVTTPSDELKELVKKHIRAGCFKLERAKTYKNGTPKTTTTGSDGREKTTSRTKQSTRKYQCPKCGLLIRATKDIADMLLCIGCQEMLVEKNN